MLCHTGTHCASRDRSCRAVAACERSCAWARAAGEERVRPAPRAHRQVGDAALVARGVHVAEADRPGGLHGGVGVQPHAEDGDVQHALRNHVEEDGRHARLVQPRQRQALRAAQHNLSVRPQCQTARRPRLTSAALSRWDPRPRPSDDQTLPPAAAAEANVMGRVRAACSHAQPCM